MGGPGAVPSLRPPAAPRFPANVVKSRKTAAIALTSKRIGANLNPATCRQPSSFVKFLVILLNRRRQIADFWFSFRLPNAGFRPALPNIGWQSTLLGKLDSDGTSKLTP
jgi:hypothetical protein